MFIHDVKKMPERVKDFLLAHLLDMGCDVTDILDIEIKNYCYALARCCNEERESVLQAIQNLSLLKDKLERKKTFKDV